MRNLITRWEVGRDSSTWQSRFGDHDQGVINRLE
jgi:hypothetical protein